MPTVRDKNNVHERCICKAVSSKSWMPLCEVRDRNAWSDSECRLLGENDEVVNLKAHARPHIRTSPRQDLWPLQRVCGSHVSGGCRYSSAPYLNLLSKHSERDELPD